MVFVQYYKPEEAAYGTLPKLKMKLFVTKANNWKLISITRKSSTSEI